MIDFSLTDAEKRLLKSLIGKKLEYYRHDPLDTFGHETVYAHIELLLEDTTVLIDYDYAPYPLFGGQDNDRPKFSVKTVTKNDAVSALEGISQINVECNQTVTGVALAEDYVTVEWEGKKDSVRILRAIIIKFEKNEIAIQGDYMMPLLDLIKGSDVASILTKQEEEFNTIPDTKFVSERFLNEL